MAGAKMIVMYPPPKDLAEFERAYSAEHLPMVGPILKAAGASKGVFSKVIGAPAGAPAFHRIAELHFPSMESLQALAASKGGQEAVAHAHQISSGGPPTIMIAEEETVTF